MLRGAAPRRPAARARLRALYPHLFRAVGTADGPGMARAMRRRPVNATHLFWRELVEEMGMPFIKTDLLLKNPLGLADALRWQAVLGPGDEAMRAMVAEHLAMMGRRAVVAPEGCPCDPRAEGAVRGAA